MKNHNLAKIIEIIGGKGTQKIKEFSKVKRGTSEVTPVETGDLPAMTTPVFETERSLRRLEEDVTGILIR